MSGDNIWALILAAGEGTRLCSLTTTLGGLTVPKQFCSLRGGASLLEEALSRAKAVAQRRHVLTVVAGQHRCWWEASLRSLPSSNVIVQPENKGTAAGLLLPLLHIMQRDPGATVIVLPSDHFFRDETKLARSLQHATRLAGVDHEHVYLLGLVPERIDPELGYIVPEDCSPAHAASVRRFVEKPAFDIARGLIHIGALWNVFIMAASARALLGLYSDRHDSLSGRMADAVKQDHLCPHDGLAVHRLYPTLHTLDFSRDVLEGHEPALRVLTVPACGWSDLGTPQRVAETLSRYRGSHEALHSVPRNAYLSLADQQSRQQYTNCRPAHT